MWKLWPGRIKKWKNDYYLNKIFKNYQLIISTLCLVFEVFLTSFCIRLQIANSLNNSLFSRKEKIQKLVVCSVRNNRISEFQNHLVFIFLLNSQFKEYISHERHHVDLANYSIRYNLSKKIYVKCNSTIYWVKHKKYSLERHT